MTYLDRYRAMTPEEICEWADGLFLRAVDRGARGDPEMTELRNIVPFLVDKLRELSRRDLTREQRDLLNKADRCGRRGEAHEAFKLRVQAERLG